MTDQYLYEETIEIEDERTPMINKRLFYILDQNAGNYNGQIMFDTSVLANSGHWTSYREGVLEIPFVVSLRSTADISASAINSFSVGLKNGYYQLIDSIQVDYNNTNVVQLQPYTNFYVNYKIMTSFSKDDEAKWGSTIGFNPDSAGSYVFSSVASANGDGYSNNIDNFQSAINFTAPEFFNEGFYQRKRKTTAFSPPYSSIPTINNTARASTIGKNLYAPDAGVAAARIYSWIVLAQIRLKDLCDFFSEMPLVKGAMMRFIINYNSANMTITTTAAGPTMVLAANGVTQLSGRTNPIMISSSSASNSGNALVTGSGTLSISCGVATNTLFRTATGAPPIPFTQCRLYVPAFAIDPLKEKQILEITPTKEIKYMDIYNYFFTNIGAGASFNQILTNGIVNPKYVIVMPFANTTVGVFANNAGLPVFQSPFDSAPGTTTPMAAITNFQVQIGGQNVFQQFNIYDFENFIHELSQANSVFGGALTGINSGLIDEYRWSNANRYYIADVGRRLKMDDEVPKSIVVAGTNATGVSMDYVCFVVFERKITIDMFTGMIIPNK